MNIIAIYSSPRPKATTSLIVNEILKNIPEGNSVETFNVNKLNIKPCIGCLKCRPDKECILPKDDAHVLSEKIKQSDVLIVGAPTYWGNIPGMLKVLLDRIVTTFEYCEARAVLKFPKPQLSGKKAIIVTSAIAPFPVNLWSSQSGGAVKALKTVFNAGGVKVSHVINISNSIKFEEKKEKYFRRARKIALSLN